MNIEQERADFEAWYQHHHGDRDVYALDESGEYANKQVQGAFNVWKARAALQSQDREDAERYRWLRQQRTISDHACVTWNIGHDWVQMDGAELDAAIDHARRSREGG